jgi:hypothetical protein
LLLFCIKTTIFIVEKQVKQYIFKSFPLGLGYKKVIFYTLRSNPILSSLA